MASKFLNMEEFNEVKKAIKMIELKTLIYNDSIAEDIPKKLLEMKKLFIVGAAFDLVCKTIPPFDKTSQVIYDEITTSKNK